MSMQKKEIIEIGDIRVSSGKTTVFSASNIGTSLILAIYDFENHVAACAHIALPDSDMGTPSEDELPAKYANLAIPAILEQFQEEGGQTTSCTVKVVGGAQLFNFGGGSGNILNIGARNHTAIQTALMKENMVIDQSDIGGNKARQVRFVVANGQPIVKQIGGEEYTV